MRRPPTPAEWVRHVTLALLAALSLFPLYFIAVNSFKSVLEYAQNNLALPTELRWGNYERAWSLMQGPLLNTTFIVVASVVLIVFVASLAAYAFAVLDFPGRRFLFFLVFALLLIPGFLTLIPLFLQIKKLPFANTYWGLILPYAAAGQAFAIFVLKTFFEQIPRELLEAARIDGATDAQTYRRVVVPLSRPVLISVGVVNLVPLWNDYLLPSLLLDSNHRTVAVALVALQGNERSSIPETGALMAAFLLSAVPLMLLFSFLMRAYIEGLTSGAVKA